MPLKHRFLLVVFVFWCASAVAQTALPPIVSPATDPTEFGSLRLDPFESVVPPEGEWSFALSTTYFNQWNGTWHTRRIHEDLGRERQPIGDDEIEALEASFPADDIFRLDLEGYRADVVISRGFASGIALQARLPWISVGSPNWDGVAEGFHDLFPVVDHYVRDLFPRGETFLYIRADGKSVVRREELARSGIGDVALSVSMPIRRGERSSQRLALTVELPTGKEETLHGSGGVDAGVRWFYDRKGVKNDVLVGAGYTRLDPNGGFLGFERSDTFHLSADYHRRVGRRTALHLGARIDSSPLAGITALNLGDPVIFYRLGVQREMLPGQWLVFDIGEEIVPQMGVDADFSFQFGWSVR
jgi:hypothetical protein